MADKQQHVIDQVQEHFGVILNTFMSGYDVFIVLPTGYRNL